jgi:hypothetical protein
VFSSNPGLSAASFWNHTVLCDSVIADEKLNFEFIATPISKCTPFFSLSL